MKKTAVIYWSGTGNTEAMANAVAEGMKEAGADVSVMTRKLQALIPVPMMALPLAVPPWEAKFLKKVNSSRCGMMSKENYPVNPSFFLALTGGAPVNGWTTGKMMLSQAELRLPPIP